MKAPKPPALQIRRRTWRNMLAELAARGGGVRESGAFLLGRRTRRRPRIARVVYFDDLEPTSLNGAVHLTHVAYTRLWALCAELGFEVLGDVHTHPGPGVKQSDIDQDNPLIAQAGHIALIVPHFARGAIRRQEVGIYEYRGDDGWIDRPSALHHRRWW